MLDAADVQNDAKDDEQQASEQGPVGMGEKLQTGGKEQQGTCYNKSKAQKWGYFLHKNVKFAAKIQNISHFSLLISHFFVPLHPHFAKITFIY